MIRKLEHEFDYNNENNTLTDKVKQEMKETVQETIYQKGIITYVDEFKDKLLQVNVKRKHHQDNMPRRKLKIKLISTS